VVAPAAFGMEQALPSLAPFHIWEAMYTVGSRRCRDHPLRCSLSAILHRPFDHLHGDLLAAEGQG
jgi:hypothetical protein